MSTKELVISTLQQPKLKSHMNELSIKHLWLFGSVASGEETPESDIDLLYEYEPKGGANRGIFEAIGVLQSTLGKKVDLVSKKFLDEKIKQSVLDSSIQIW